MGHHALQNVGGGSGRSVAPLQPGRLPARFSLVQCGEHAQVEGVVLIDRDRVIVRRRLDQRLAFTLSVPVSAYRGVALRMLPASGGAGYLATLSLVHKDPALSLTLFAGAGRDIVTDAWTAWGRALDLPLLAQDARGRLEEVPSPSLFMTGMPAPRRRRSCLALRRPRFLTRRKIGEAGLLPVWRGEREIIARE